MASTTYSANIPAKTLPPVFTTSSHKHDSIVPADSPDYNLDYVAKPQPNTQPNEDSVPNLTEAITLMTHELKCHKPSSGVSSGVNTRKPDTFDSSDPKKLNNFILLCKLYFQNNSTCFNDKSKVTFALSYLHGLALDYFELTLMDSDTDPNWLSDWSAFIQVLHTQFSPIDPTADAKVGLDNLKMCDNHCIIKYNVNFNHLAICC